MKIKNVVMRLGFRFNVVSECQQSSTKSYLPKKIKSNLGFTLVELLVAIAIFAVLSMKWMVAYLNRHGLSIFGHYRIAAALVAAVLFL